MKINQLFEGDLTSLGYFVDNPGGTWLEKKKKHARDAYPELAVGSITALIGQHAYVEIKTSHIIELRGAMGEEKFRHSGPKYDSLAQSVEENGWLKDQAWIMIFVGYYGHAAIGEGNHRVAYAYDHNIEWLRCDIRYFSGAEEYDGKMNPEYLAKNGLIRLASAS